MEILSFEQALQITKNSRRHLLLGNGFSIALFPDKFRYDALFNRIDFSKHPKIEKVFINLKTKDFEIVINALRSAANILPIYSEGADVDRIIKHDANLLKDLLITGLTSTHPNRPTDVSDKQYIKCRKFLAHFIGEGRKLAKDLRGKIYTLNYDLLLYWTLLHDQDLEWNNRKSISKFNHVTENLKHDDGFRTPIDNSDAPYVTWQAEGAADGQNIHYLHGALHLFDNGVDLEKYCWERSGKNPIIDQVKEALDLNKFPLFVSGGTSQEKLMRIRHNGYLQRSLKSFAAICRPAKSSDTVLFIFGHSLASNDDHVLQFIATGTIKRVFISIYGDISTNQNKELVRKVNLLKSRRSSINPLLITFFQAVDGMIWG